MKNLTLLILLLFVGVSCDYTPIQQSLEVTSPNDEIKLVFNNESSKPSYSITYKGKSLIEPSALGFEFQNTAPLDSGLQVVAHELASADETWEQPWGEQRLIRDHHNRLLIYLEEQKAPNRKLNIEFKVFNDGVGFRYIFPEENGVDSIKITDELTEFSFADNHTTWYIPAYDRMKYEILYQEAKIDKLDTAHTPLTIKTTDEVYVSLHEASLVDFASMTLYGNRKNTLKSDLVPWKDGVKVKAKSGFKSSWRTIQIADTPGSLIESYLILNLNEPNKLGDVSWVNPMKYIGIWWGIHIHNWTFEQGPKLGATTENTIAHIDFAAKHGFDEVLVEGWNEGFEKGWHRDFGPNQNYTTPNPRFDWFRLQEYALSQGVTIQAYNETCANPINYLSQIDSAYGMYERLGYKSVKVGQVNSKLVNGEWHHGQYGVNYYQTVVEKGAEHKLAINFHEPIKATGLRRTYPNLVSREGARGQEFNAWGNDRPEGHNPPEHLTILPFTRMLSGPMDFTPGIFRVDIPQSEVNFVNSTISKQLAIYVVIYSPIQMAADLIENYEGHPALQFIKDVPTDWETTKVLEAQIADYIITARKDKASEDWYLGAITDEESRAFEISLDFLDEGQYEAQIYQDSDKTNLESTPMEYEIVKTTVNQKGTISLKLAKSGGAAIRFKKL